MTHWFKLSCCACLCAAAVGISFTRSRGIDAAELAPASAAATADGLSAAKPASAVTDADIIAFINEQISKGWKDAGIGASAKATDGEWCRRVYLDIIGRVPTVDELNAFTASGGPDKRLNLVNMLLGESMPTSAMVKVAPGHDAESYLQEYAHNWAQNYSILLVGRPPAQRANRELVNRDGMQAFLRNGFLRNKPWDKIVAEIVSARGTTAPDSPQFNGATNFLVNKLQENAAEATAKTAKYFLGVQVQCTQCHNHPFNDWKQDQFWGLNAFFRQTKSQTNRNGQDVQYVTLDNEDFRGEGNNPKEAEIYYELRNGVLQVAYPTFIDGTKINPSGYVNEVDRRTELASLIVKHDNFGRAMVNRMWSHFLGYGFTKPVDDMGPHNPVSHPELLDRLGREFSSRGHNVKQLIRWIALSDAYALSSKATTLNKKDDPSLGEKPLFSHFYVRQMEAENLYESLLAITKAAEGNYEEQMQKRRQWLSQFTVTFGNDEGTEATTFDGTIPQVLMMMNGELTKSALSGTFMKNLVGSGAPLKDKIEYLYLATLSRKPTSQELALNMSARGADASDALQDVFWALLNSNEFIFNH